MIKNIYTVRDVKSNFFTGIFLDFDDKSATRVFSECASDERTIISKFPRDFDLVRLGTFDEDTGVIVPHPSFEFICNASAVKREYVREDVVDG